MIHLDDAADDPGLVVYEPPGHRSDSVANPLTGLGGFNDKGAVGRPNPWVMPLTDDELRTLYTSNGVARRIVDIIPSRATRRGWTCPDVPATEDKRLRTWTRNREAMSMARLHGGAVLLMVTEDDIPRQFRARPEEWLREPLDLERVGALHALQVFDALEARPMLWDEDVRSPGFRMPRIWSIAAAGFRAEVHASRVVHFRGARRPPSETRWGRTNTMPDDSVLQGVWDEIRRLTETMQGGAVLAAELRESVLKISGLAQKATGDEAGALQARIALMQRTKSMLGTVMIGENDEYQNLGNAPTGFADLSDAAKSMLAAVTGIPEVVLFGATPGGLNTDGDSAWEGFRQLVSDYQETQREELEQLYTVIYAAQDGPTAGQIPDEWALEFASLDEPDEQALALLRKTVAETDAIYMGQGVYGPEEVAVSRFGEEGWSMELEAVPVPDPEADARLEAELAAQVAAAAGPPEKGPPRKDAAGDGCCVLVPAADPGLGTAVSSAIGQLLELEREPHVTVLFLGELGAEAQAEVVAAVADEASSQRATVLEGGQVRAFPHGPHGTPIVVEFDAWALSELNGSLLRRLAHVVEARQHPRYRPHLTIGYAPSPLDAEAIGRLLQVDASAVRVPVALLQVVAGAEVLAAAPVSG